MAPSSGDIYKHYFDDPTLSDLTIRLSDRDVHVHRIVLCRRSVYFDKLLLGGFKEAGLKEVELHEDDPESMYAVLRHIYGFAYHDVLKDHKATLQSLARLYITADKYQAEGLRKKTHGKIRGHRNCRSLTDIDDFLNALEIIVTVTTPQDKHARAVMINACVKHFSRLKQTPDFFALLREHGDIGAEILDHPCLASMLEGTWYCDGIEHAEAVPSCFGCDQPFSQSYVRSHRHLKIWTCSACGYKGHPACLVCSENEDDRVDVVWEWNGGDDVEDQ